MVLVGMQPVLTHVPPNSLRSIIATLIPAATSRRARGGPACPVPMMIASNGAIAPIGEGGGTRYLHFRLVVADDLRNQLAGNIGQTHVAAVEIISQPLVIHAEQG